MRRNREGKVSAPRSLLGALHALFVLGPWSDRIFSWTRRWDDRGGLCGHAVGNYKVSRIMSCRTFRDLFTPQN